MHVDAEVDLLLKIYKKILFCVTAVTKTAECCNGAVFWVFVD